MQLKGELDSSLGDTKAKPSAEAVIGGAQFWDGLKQSAGEESGGIVRALLSPKDRKSIGKDFWGWLAQTGEGALSGVVNSFVQNLLTGRSKGLTGGAGAIGGLVGGLLGGQSSSTGAPATLGSAGAALSMAGIPGGDALTMAAQAQAMMGAGGMGRDPGMSGGGGASSLGLLGMLGKGGLMGSKGLIGAMWQKGGLFANKGLFTSSGSLGSFGAALPWIGGGLALNSLLGNPLGKVFKGLGHLFHFEHGGRPPLHQWSVGGEKGVEVFRSDMGRCP